MAGTAVSERPRHRAPAGASCDPEVVILTVVVVSIIGLAFLFMIGTVIYGIGLAAFEGLVELVRSAPDRLSPRITRQQALQSTAANPEVLSPGEISGMEPPELSAEAMWHRMQGTSRKTRRRSQ